jgi:hypothetical protein
MGEGGHGNHAEHLKEGEDTRADVVVAVPVVVGRAVEPRPSDDDEQKREAA